jgi:hypothetical protein
VHVQGDHIWNGPGVGSELLLEIHSEYVSEFLWALISSGRGFLAWYRRFGANRVSALARVQHELELLGSVSGDMLL